MGRIEAIKTFFERKDSISPNGGRKVSMTEFKALEQADREELSQLAAAELGVEIG